MSVFELWILFVLGPNLKQLLSWVMPVFVIFTILSLIVAAVMKKEAEESRKRELSCEDAERRVLTVCLKSAKVLTILTVLTAFGNVMAPSEKQMYLLAGSYVVTNVEGIDQLPINVVDAANSYLDKIKNIEIED